MRGRTDEHQTTSAKWDEFFFFLKGGGTRIFFSPPTKKRRKKAGHWWGVLHLPLLPSPMWLVKKRKVNGQTSISFWLSACVAPLQLTPEWAPMGPSFSALSISMDIQGIYLLEGKYCLFHKCVYIFLKPRTTVRLEGRRRERPHYKKLAEG